MHSKHGSGAVNLVVSRKSGGVMRALVNAGDKRVKRKRGSMSAAPIAARIERGCEKRTRSAGSIACVSDNVDFRGTGTDGGNFERTSTTAEDGGDDTQTRKKDSHSKCRA